MKKYPILLTAATLLAATSAYGDIIVRNNSTENLNLAAAWAGDVAPGSSDTASWDASGTLANTLGATVTWGGLDVSGASGTVSISSSTYTANYGAINLGTNNLSLTGTSLSNIRLTALTGSGTLTLNSGATVLNTGILQGGADALNFTGTLALRGGAATTSAGSVATSWLAFGQLGGSASLTQAAGTAFALDTGAVANNAKDIIFDGSVWNGKTINLTSLTGFGSIRSDSGTGSTSYTLSVNQSTNTTFNGLILAHAAGTNSRSINFIKSGAGVLTLAGLVGNQTASGGTGNGLTNITVNGGTLVMTADNTAKGTITVNTGALLRMENAGAGTGFTGGNSSMSVNYIVNSGGEMQVYRNGAAALGTGSITLNHGSTLSQTGGNWNFNNNITLGTASGDVATIGNRSSSGPQRVLKLSGVLSGNGGVTFNNYVGETMNNAGTSGFILTNSNTFTGPMTINAGAVVRIGGVSSTDSGSVNLGASATGSVAGTVTVVNNGILVFGRSDSHTFANTISGTGAVNIGGQTGSLIAGAGTQTVTLTGTNSHGATNVAQGTLATGNTAALGTGAVNVASGATLQIGNGTTNTVTLGSGASLALAGGATLKFLGADSAIALQGAGTYTLGNVTLDLNGLFNAAGTYHLISGGNAAGGTQGTLSFSNFDNANFSAVFSGGDLVVTAIPEPSTYGLIGAGALGAIAFVRRRRKTVA